VPKLAALIDQGLDQVRMAVAERRDRDSAGEIEIFSPVVEKKIRRRCHARRQDRPRIVGMSGKSSAKLLTKAVEQQCDGMTAGHGVFIVVAAGLAVPRPRKFHP